MKPQKNIAELKVTLPTIFDKVPDETILKSVQSFRKRLSACVQAQGRHFVNSIKEVTTRSV